MGADTPTWGHGNLACSADRLSVVKCGLLAVLAAAPLFVAGCDAGRSGIPAQPNNGTSAGASRTAIQRVTHPEPGCGPGGEVRADSRYRDGVIRVRTTQSGHALIYAVLTAVPRARLVAAFIALTRPGTAPYHRHVVRRSNVVSGRVVSPRRLVLAVPTGLKPGHYPIYAVVRGLGLCPDGSGGTSEIVGRRGRVVVASSSAPPLGALHHIHR